MATKQGKASSMTAGADSGVGRLQKAGMKTANFKNGGMVEGSAAEERGESKAFERKEDEKTERPTKKYAAGGMVDSNVLTPSGGGKSRGGGAAVKGTKFRGVF